MATERPPILSGIRLLHVTTALLLLAVTFVTGRILERARLAGLPTTVTVTAKQRTPGPCGTTYHLAFEDDAGRSYDGQLVTEGAWNRLHVGDPLPARRHVDGTLASVELGGMP